MELKKSKTYEIIDIINWNDAGELNINPKYQRNPVWDETAKSFLVDSILRDYPMPPLFYRQLFFLEERKVKREVIDGQQRTRTIIDFYNNKFPVLRKHNQTYGGCYFKDLPEGEQERFLRYNVFVDTISEKDDSIIYDIFARMNSNAANVNKQEVRNAKYWGDFKTAVYSTASSIRDNFLKYETFSNKSLARMADMEYVSTLFILAISGCTTGSNTQIDKYYKDFDKNFENAIEIENNIIETFKNIDKIYNFISDKIIFFNNKNYLFDLVGYIFVSKGIISIDKISSFELPPYDYIADKLFSLHYQLKDVKKRADDVDKCISDYESYHRVHSTSKDSREKRIAFLVEYLRY